MVWGMSFPSRFGDYWPLGKNEGEGAERANNSWSHRLREHFVASTPEEQLRLYSHKDGSEAWNYPFHAMIKFQKEIGTKPSPDEPTLTPIEPHEPLQYFQTDKGYKNLGSMIALNAGLLAVDETLKGIIERLEPEVHQFFPVEIRMPRKRLYPKQYYILVIGRYLDSFSADDSNKDAVRQWEGYDLFTHEDTKKGVGGLAFRKSIFGEASIWRQKRFTSLLTCLSDELVSEVGKAGLRIPKHYQMKEV